MKQAVHQNGLHGEIAALQAVPPWYKRQQCKSQGEHREAKDEALRGFPVQTARVSSHFVRRGFILGTSHRHQAALLSLRAIDMAAIPTIAPASASSTHSGIAGTAVPGSKVWSA